ncbi:hypothetical protein SAMN05443543_108211 [Flavobacterium flevense]|nr:hypothetical protein SAMN05443543_108211 [Flavobacterium flevense]
MIKQSKWLNKSFQIRDRKPVENNLHKMYEAIKSIKGNFKR